MSITSLIYDALAVVIVVLAIIKGKKDGFVKTALQTIGYLCAAVAALVVANISTALIYTAAMQPAVISVIENALLENASPENMVEAVTEAVVTLPAVAELLFDFEDVAAVLSNTVGLDAGAIAAAVESGVIRPVIEPMLNTLIFIITLLVLTAIVTAVAKGSKVFNDVPVVGSFNALFGAAAGLAWGIIEVGVAAVIIGFVISGGLFPEYFSEKIISQTYIFKWIYFAVQSGEFPI